MPRQTLPHDLGIAFGVRAAALAGVGEGRLRGRDLERPFHGSRVLSAAYPRVADRTWEAEIESVERRIAAYLPVMPDGAFFVGPTAAHVHGAPLPTGIHTAIWVGVHHPRTAPHRDGVRGVQVLPRMAEVVTARGVAVTDPATSWAMLGGALDVYDLTAVADHFIRIPRMPGGFRVLDERAICTLEDLSSALDAGRRRGAIRLREARDRARTGASSRPETWMRLLLVDSGLPEPAIDVDVHDEFGQFAGCLDAAYPDRKVGIEYEGSGHLTKAQLDRDIDKYTALNALGWRIVRLTSTHVFRQPQEAVRRVRAALYRAPAG